MDTKNDTKLGMLIYAMKSRAVMMQDYEIASRIRTIEKNEKGLDDEAQLVLINEIAVEMESKFKLKPSMVGDTFNVPQENLDVINDTFTDCQDLEYEANIILQKVAKLRRASFELIRKSIPEIPEDCNFTFHHKTGTVTIISDENDKINQLLNKRF
jgi:hypothetical protein